jgi:L-seryl-tRNA(Ser) seleniumtransferase
VSPSAKKKGAGGRQSGAKPDGASALRGLAAVDEVLRQPQVAALLERYPRAVVVDAARTVIDRLRREILAGEREVGPDELSAALLAPWVERLVERAVTPSLRRVINATGVVAHTNIGRSLLPDEAVQAVVQAARGYSDFEIDLATGKRATRQDHLHDALCAVTGADDALAVNNNAAAVLLALAATARGGEVLVSRGQLVEIGDGFRIPDILAESGARLVEVGTTNRTHLRDFESAWSDQTRAVLRVHTSNYRIVGFTSEPSVAELVGLAHERGAVVIDDLGSGALAPLPLFADEPSARDSLDAGVDAVTFSGDKLLGGPQAGLVVGSAEVVGAMRRHPLARAVRIDKLDVAALDAVLRLYLDPDQALARVPTLAMLAAPVELVRERAERLRALLAEQRAAQPVAGGAGADDAAAHSASAEVGAGEVVDSVARAGAGALPISEVASAALALDDPGGDPDALATALRCGDPAVLARVHDGQVLLDLRAVSDAELDDLAAAAGAALTARR